MGVLRFAGVLAIVLGLSGVGTAHAEEPVPPLPRPPKCDIITPIEGGPDIIDCGGGRPSGLELRMPLLDGPFHMREAEQGIGLALSFVDEVNPYGKEYRITVLGEGYEATSDFAPSLCRRFEGLRHGRWYRVHGTVRDGEGREMNLERHLWISGPYHTEYVMSPDDPWLADRIDEVVSIYSLTEQAREMIRRVPVRIYRSEPGYAGYSGASAGIGLGLATSPWVMAHEMMHAFWHVWDGFPQPCDQMNIWTFRRDLAEFILTFKALDILGGVNPLEEWRGYFDFATSDFDYFRSRAGEDGWQLLDRIYRTRDHYDSDVWNLVYHIADTDPPMLAMGKPRLLPPPLRGYFAGFISPVEGAETASWEDELSRYHSLTAEDYRLWVRTSPFYQRAGRYIGRPLPGPPLTIEEPLREHIRRADRQALVDFVNTLEEMSCHGDDRCLVLWEHDPIFWYWHVREHLIRMRLYLGEVGPETGVELEESNWRAVEEGLAAIASCGTNVGGARQTIQSLVEVTPRQRMALEAILDVRSEVNLDWLCGWGEGVSELGLGEAGPPHRVLWSGRGLPDEERCQGTGLYERPVLTCEEERGR